MTAVTALALRKGRFVRSATGAALVCALTGLAACSQPDHRAVPASQTSRGSEPAAGASPASTASPESPTSRRSAVSSSGILPSSRPPTVTKLLVFVEENHSLDQMKADMPYTFGLARRFGYATRYTAIRHPSLPNYIAIAGGQTYGITNDGPPSANPVSGSSVFGQAISYGKTAAIYAEGMTSTCSTGAGDGRYAVKHNPWPYFSKERALCQNYDVPVDRLGAAVTRGTLPNVGMVVPNLCNDAHDCSLGTADTWFRGWMDKIFNGPDWKSGRLAVVLTADEDDASQGNTVLTVVIHPSQKAKVVSSPLTHYSLTRLYEEVAGMRYLSAAATAPSMATAFGLPISRLP